MEKVEIDNAWLPYECTPIVFNVTLRIRMAEDGWKPVLMRGKCRFCCRKRGFLGVRMEGDERA